jgi:hypothetical protein
VNGPGYDHHTYIELDGAHITGNHGGSALLLKDYAKVTLLLVEGTGNELSTATASYAGLGAPEHTALTITGRGTLAAKGGDRGAGIDGGIGVAGGTITITSGTPPLVR